MNSRNPSSPNTPPRDTNPANRDPLDGTPGAHPVGTGVGAVAGGLTGAGVGVAVGGPIGGAIGAAAGAIAGGYGGKAAAEEIDPTAEDAYWRETYRSRPYYDQNTTYDTFAPAYRLGWESRTKKPEWKDRDFDHVENDLQSEWSKMKSSTSLSWDKAKLAVRDAWDRLSMQRAENEGMSTARTDQNRPGR